MAALTMDEIFTTSSEVNAELLPIAFAVIGQIQGVGFVKSLVVLLNSGSTTSWINKKCLLKDIHGYTVEPITGSTLAGTFTSKELVCLPDMVVQEQ